ncbi:MAG: hypothetical protein ACT4PW_05600 [Acidimicrobiia bacterium]
MAALVGALVAVVGFVMATTGLDDNSFLTHLATGRLIWDTGGIPAADPYTFTAPGHPWVVQSWLASAVYGGADRLGGGAAVVLVVGAGGAAIAALAWALTRPAGMLGGRLVLLVPVVVIGTEGWVERPLLFGLAALGLLLLAAEGRLDARWTVPVMWVWVNTHGSFPLGLLAVALMAGGRRLDREPAATELAVLKWAAVGTALGALNPLGPRLLAFPFGLLSRQDALRGIVEWQAPRFTDPDERAFLVLIVLGVVALARRPAWRSALVLAVFIPAALLSARNIVVASLVLLPAVAPGLGGLGTVDGLERRRWCRAAAAAIAAVAVVAVVARYRGPAFPTEAYPVAAVDWLVRTDRLGPDSRLVAQDYVGNYLEARFGTGVPVFIDDRYDMLPTVLIEDYRTLLGGRPGWDEVLRRRRAVSVLWSAETPLASLLDASPDWSVVYRDDDWIVAQPEP